MTQTTADKLANAAQALRSAQKDYMADRGNEVRGKIVAEYAEKLDKALAEYEAEKAKPKCHGVSFGSYENTILLPRPKHMYPTSRNDWITIDKCMLDEILELWKEGVWTLECCCGHCKSEGYIAVHEYSRENIESLGYLKSETYPHVYVAKTNHNEVWNERS